MKSKPHSSAEYMTSAYEGVIGNFWPEVSDLNCLWKSCHPQSKVQLNDKEIGEEPVRADLNLKMLNKRVKVRADDLRNTGNVTFSPHEC